MSAQLFSVSFRWFVFLCVFLTISACGDSSSGKKASDTGPKTIGYSSTAVQTTSIESSEQCPDGGIQVHAGIDINQNGVLDEDEINNTQTLCNLSTDLVKAKVEKLQTDSACVNGGHRLTIGYDVNKNDQVDVEEINQSLLFCNQPPITQLGIAVFSQGAEPEGENCKFGGSRVSVGIDTDLDVVLDNDEITSSQFQCINNQAISLLPYDEYDYCDVVYCNGFEGVDDYEYAILQGVAGERIIGRIFDDNVGEVSITASSDAPEWLKVSLIEGEDAYYNYEEYEYSEIKFYNIIIDQSQIPAEATGKSYAITLTISDETVSYNLQKNFRVIEPITVTFDQEELILAEPEDGTKLTTFVKVNFSKPLPSASIAQDNYYDSSTLYIKKYIIDENGDENYFYSNDDFKVSWVSADFFEGQTQAILMVEVFDDSLPEATEEYRVTVGFPTRSSEDLFFTDSSLDVTIQGDNDVPITASITFDAETIVEGNDGDVLNRMPYTIQFEPAIPESGSISLIVKAKDDSSVTEDVGLSCSSNSYNSISFYCSSSIQIYLSEGATEYKGEVLIKQDLNKEEIEFFEVSLGSNTNFVVNGLEGQFSITDDDVSPVIGFSESVIEAYYRTNLVKASVLLANPTSEDVTFFLTTGDSDSAIEGVHYDFAVSQPITMKPGKIAFDIPIIIYGTEFESSEIEANISINVEAGAVLSESSQTLKVILDHVASYNLSINQFILPIPSGVSPYNTFYSRSIHMDNNKNIYVVGEIEDGHALVGNISAGEDDIFVSKFDSAGLHIWSKQFGTSTDDYLSKRYFNTDTGEVVIKSSDVIYRVASSGALTQLSLPDVYTNLNSVKFKTDSSSNLYLLSHKYSNNDDLDSDGVSSELLLFKYNTNNELVWTVDDFSDIEANHASFYLNNLDIELTTSGRPFVFGRISSSMVLGKASLGGYDYAGFSFSKETGQVLSYERFGGSGYNNSYLKTVPYKSDQVIAYYNLSLLDQVNGQTATEYNRAVQVVFNADGAKASEEIINHPYSTYGISNVFKSSDDLYFLQENNSNRDLTLLDEALGKQESVYLSSNYYSDDGYNIQQSPILADDGGYYLIGDERIQKMTSHLSIR